MVALINSIAPGLCDNHELWNEQNRQKYTKESMKLAYEWLDIQIFIRSNELLDGKVGEKSNMIYLSQFPTAKLRPGAPLRAHRLSNKYVSCFYARIKKKYHKQK